MSLACSRPTRAFPARQLHHVPKGPFAGVFRTRLPAPSHEKNSDFLFPPLCQENFHFSILQFLMNFHCPLNHWSLIGNWKLRIAEWSDADVGLDAHFPLLHVCLAHTQIAEEEL